MRCYVVTGPEVDMWKSVLIHVSSQAKRLREEAEAEEQYEREAQRALELEEQIRADAELQQLERERLFQARKRASSDATEVPPPAGEGNTHSESFNQQIEWHGIIFNKVRLYHPEKGESSS